MWRAGLHALLLRAHHYLGTYRTDNRALPEWQWTVVFQQAGFLLLRGGSVSYLFSSWAARLPSAYAMYFLCAHHQTSPPLLGAHAPSIPPVHDGGRLKQGGKMRTVFHAARLFSQ